MIFCFYCHHVRCRSLAKSLLPANARAHSLTVWSTPKVSTLWPLWSPNGWSQKKQTSNCLWLPALGIPESRSALVHRRLLGTSSLDSPNSLLSSVLRHAVSKCSSFTLQLSWTELVAATLVPLYRILYKSCQQSHLHQYVTAQEMEVKPPAFQTVAESQQKSCNLHPVLGTI